MKTDKREACADLRCPEGVEIAEAAGEGYQVLNRCQGWRVAVITYAERFRRGNICCLERHMETDEVFVLMAGQATLFLGPEGIPLDMEPFLSYNVKRAAWHAICVSEDARVLICENADTGAENTEYKEWRETCE